MNSVFFDISKKRVDLIDIGRIHIPGGVSLEQSLALVDIFALDSSPAA